MEQEYTGHLISTAALTIRAYHWMNHAKGYEIERAIPDFDVLYTHEGCYRITVNGTSVVSRAGDIVILPPASFLRLRAECDSRQFYCHFSMASTERLDLGGSFEQFRLPDSCGALISAYQRLIEARTRDELPLSPDAELFFKLFLLQLVECCPKNRICFLGEGHAFLPEEIIRAVDYIHDHVAENVTAETLAKLTGFNAAYFSRHFKKYMGVSPMGYGTDYRMSFARHLVLSTGRGLKEIAAQTGFTDQFAFSKRFKKYYGISPSDLRKTSI